MGPLKLNTGCGLLLVGMMGRGEFREEREDDDPMWSREDRRLSCANISTQALGSPKSGVWLSLSRREELEPLKTLAPCWSRPGGEISGDTGVALRLPRCSTGDCSTGE